jgi:hypothetical protein
MASPLKYLELQCIDGVTYKHFVDSWSFSDGCYILVIKRDSTGAVTESYSYAERNTIRVRFMLEEPKIEI